MTTLVEKFKITWEAQVEAKSRERADMALRHIAAALDRDISIEVYEQHEKNKGLYRAVFSLELNAEEAAPAVFETLLLNGRLAEEWYLVSPRQEENGGWRLSGTAETGKIEGVTFIRFELGNDGNES